MDRVLKRWQAHAERRGGVAVVLPIALLLPPLACAPTGVPVKESESPGVPSAAAVPVPLMDTDSRDVKLSSLQLTFRLPMANQWTAQRYGRWWGARHTPSASTLQLKRWPTASLVDREDCEAEARLGNPALTDARPSRLASKAELRVAEGLTTDRRVFVWNEGEHRHGQVLVVGFGLRECLVLRFATSATGPRASRTVAETLATALLMVDTLHPLEREIPREFRD